MHRKSRVSQAQQRGLATPWLSIRLVAATAAVVLLGAVGNGAAAQSAAALAPQVVVPTETAPLADIAASLANRPPAPRAAQPVEMPHPARNRSATAPGAGEIAALPQLAPTVSGFNAPNVNVTLGGFTGLTGRDNDITGFELEPPDQALAANNNQVLEIVNNVLRAFDNNGNPLIPVVSTAAALGLGGLHLSDPILLFDPSVGRWFFVQLIWSSPSATCGSSSFCGFVIAVSKTSNALGAYFVYRYQTPSNLLSCPTFNCFPDYPKVGYDANGLYITADMFSNAGPFVGVTTYALAKTALVNGLPLDSTNTYFHDDAADFVIQPSFPALNQPFVTDNGGTEYLMTLRAPQSLPGNFVVRVIAITNTSQLNGNPNALQWLSTDVDGQEAYGAAVPSTQPSTPDPICSVPGKLDADFAAFFPPVLFLGNPPFLVGTAHSGARDGNGLARDIVNYFAVLPTVSGPSLTASVVLHGHIVPPNGFSIMYPSLALDAARGRGILGVSATGTTFNPSTVVLEVPDGLSPLMPFVTGVGATTDGGFTGCGGGVGRWGDYAYATVDPVTGTFYAANEYIPDPTHFPPGFATNWGTYITSMVIH